MKKILAIAIAFSSVSLAACANKSIESSSSSLSGIDFNYSNVIRMSYGQDLENKQWSSGKEDCSARLIKESILSNYEVHQYDKRSFIIRQNKCSNVEAPIMYLMLGKNKNLLLDTGADEPTQGQELAELVQELLSKYGNSSELLVIHSHHHSDHTAGDSAFAKLANVELVSANKDSFEDFYSKQEVKIDLGDRELSLLKTPGHQEEAITVYDSHTNWLLTGDSFYPGMLYVKNWADYKQSIAKIYEFAKTKPVSYVLGAHIEMSQEAGQMYKIGSLYQPDEASMAMSLEDLQGLHQQLQANEEGQLTAENYIVQPLNGVQKSLSNLVRWAKN